MCTKKKQILEKERKVCLYLQKYENVGHTRRKDGWYTFRPKLLAESYIILSTFRPVAETYIIYILLIYTIRPIKFFFYCFGQKLQFIFFGQIYLLYVSAKKKVWSCKLLECNPGLSLLWIMDIPLLEGGFVICSFFCGA